MPLTKNFKETVLARAQREPAFARALFDEAMTLFLNGDADTAKAMLRDVVNVTLGFEALAASIDKSPKSLHRMLSTSGNPTMANLATIFSALCSGLNVEIRAKSVRLS